MKFRTKYQRVRAGISFDPKKRRTKSEFKDETDINLIVAKYRRTGVLPPKAREAAARYGDFSGVPTYHDMFNRVLAAQEMFDALPASVRKEFDNDPGRFIEATQTEQGQKLMVELGLATVKEAPLEAPARASQDDNKAPVPPASAAKKKTAAKTSEASEGGE